MSRNYYKYFFFLVFIFILGTLSSQECKDFHRNADCYVYVPLERDFRIYNQAKSLLVPANRTTIYKIILYGGKDYIVGVCSEPGYYRKIKLRILDDSGKKVLYDNTQHDFIESFGFSVERTLPIIMEVTVVAPQDNKNICVGFQILSSEPETRDTSLK